MFQSKKQRFALFMYLELTKIDNKEISFCQEIYIIYVLLYP